MADYAEGPFERVVNVGWGAGSGFDGLFMMWVLQDIPGTGTLTVRARSSVEPPWGVFPQPLRLAVPPPELGGSPTIYEGSGFASRVPVAFNGEISYRNCEGAGSLYPYGRFKPYWDVEFGVAGDGSPWTLPDWSTGKLYNPTSGDYLAWTNLDNACLLQGPNERYDLVDAILLP